MEETITTPRGAKLKVVPAMSTDGAGVMLLIMFDTPTHVKHVEVFLSPQNAFDLADELTH